MEETQWENGKENAMSRIMDSILEQLFYGNINVSEYFSPDKDSLFQKEKMAYKENEKRFHDRLPPDLCREYEELVTEAVDFVSMEYVVYFKEGARMGAKLLMDLLEE